MSVVAWVFPLVVAATESSAAPCRWVGEAADPFTGRDARYVVGRFPLDELGSVEADVVVRRADDGWVVLGLAFQERGVTARQVQGTLQLLLADGTVVAVPLAEPEQPTASVPLTPFGSVITTHQLVGRVSAADAQAVAGAAGITHLRHDLLTGGRVTRELRPGQSRDLLGLFACAAAP